MSSKELQCPNHCGPLILFETPIPILYLLDEEILDMFEDEPTPIGRFGFLTAACPKCGFITTEGVTRCEEIRGEAEDMAPRRAEEDDKEGGKDLIMKFLTFLDDREDMIGTREEKEAVIKAFYEEIR